MKYKLIIATIGVNDSKIKPPLTVDKSSRAYLNAQRDAEKFAITEFEKKLNKEFENGYEFIKEISVEYIWKSIPLNLAPCLSVVGEI